MSAIERLIRDPAHPLPVSYVGCARRVRPEDLQAWVAGLRAKARKAA